MSFIHCSSDCTYQQEGYCALEKAAEITNSVKADGCLHYIQKKKAEGSKYNALKGK